MLRVALSVATLAFFVVVVWGMYRGWVHRRRRQEWATGEFPTPPADPGPPLLGPTTGLSIGSTIAGDWQDRVAVGDIGFRATAELSLHRAGVLLTREGASAIWLPLGALQGIRTDQKLAGKVTARGGLLVLRWAVGATVVDTGFRGDGTDSYPEWLQAVGELIETGQSKEQQA